MESFWEVSITLAVIVGAIALGIGLGWLLLHGLLRAAFHRARAVVRRIAERRRSQRQAAERREGERRA